MAPCPPSFSPSACALTANGTRAHAGQNPDFSPVLEVLCFKPIPKSGCPVTERCT